MSPSLSAPRLIPPSGVNYHGVDEVPIADLTHALQRVAAFLQDLAPRARLLRFADWWQHDGLHFYQGEKALLPANDEEGRLLSHEPVHIDELSRQSALSPPTVASTLMMLELKGAVRQIGTMSSVLAHQGHRWVTPKVRPAGKTLCQPRYQPPPGPRP